MHNHILQSISQQISAIDAMIKSHGAPINEAETETKIIEPILASLGYNKTDFTKRSHSTVTNGYPDYTLLGDKPQKWILEVKKFGHSLQLADEVQATNYGFHQVTNWAVLTNGKTWYIYNVHYQKPLPEKRVLQIDDLFVGDKAAVELLSCLSHPAMLQDSLTQAWTRKRVEALIRAEFSAPQSSTRLFLVQRVKQTTNLDVDDTVVGDVLSDLAKAATSHLSVTTNSPATRTVVTTHIPSSPDTRYTFDQITQNPSLATGQSPTELFFSDGTSIKIRNWAEASYEIILKVGNTYSLPSLPFSGGRRGKNYFINTTATHGSGKPMSSSRKALIGNNHVYIDTNRSAANVCGCISAFLQAISLPKDSVEVTI